MQIPGHQRFDLFYRLRAGYGVQQFRQPGAGLKSIRPGGLDQRVDQRAGVGTGWGVAEQPCFSSNDEGPDRVFGAVVVCALHAVPGNSRRLSAFRKEVAKAWLRALRRRGQHGRMTWQRFLRYVGRYIPSVRVVHPYPNQRFTS